MIKLSKTFKNFCIIILLILLISIDNSQFVKASAMDNYQSEFVTEELRLRVPSDYKEVWLKAEKNIWDTWLSGKKGFLNRQIFWDKGREEGLILVNWESKKLWKSIPISEVNVVQQKFEDNVKAALNVNENPFELIYEGELDKQT